jgi:hypothetical protein
MPPPDAKDPTEMLPQGHLAVPISVEQKSAVLRICVVLRKQPDGRSALVVLRDTLDARVYRGCILDAGGGVVQWVELWVQNPSALAGSVAARRGTVTNSLFDRRWQRMVKGVEKLAPGELIRTGWESLPQPATFINPVAAEPVHPADAASGGPLHLCRDDTFLAAAGLPPYSASPHRYLILSREGGEAKFVPLTPDAPANASTRPMAEVLPGVADLMPFNPAAGQVMVRTYATRSFAEYVDALSGAGDAGAASAPASNAAPAGATGGADATANGNGWLFVGHHGAAGRLVETLHLKLRALSDAVDAVAAAAKSTQLPLLNLSADSFRVDVAPAARGLPSHWTAKVRLVDPGDVVEWALPGADVRYYLPARPGVGSIYRASSGQSVQGRGSVRVRQVLPAGAAKNAVVLEGTFASQERLEVAGRDLVWFRMSPGGGTLDVYARLEKAAALAAGEWRFRSVPLSPAPNVLAALQAEESFAADVPFEHLPLLSTPSDLYSLGVLAVRTLLTNARTSLPVALDEALSLARQVAQDPARSAPLGARVGRLLAQDKRWADSLGPHRLTNEPVRDSQVFEMVPADVWCDVLALVVRLFPGVGPDSYARDLGDAPPEGLHAVFARPLEELAGLLLRTRSLLLIDWAFNREVNAAIRSTLTKLSPELAAGRGVGV